MTGIRAQRKGLRAQKNRIMDHEAFEPESGIRLITWSKNLLSQYNFRSMRFVSIAFPGRGTLPILASGWRGGWQQFLSYEVLVV